MTDHDEPRPGEIAIPLPPATDAGVYFIGTIHTPWRTRGQCPKRGNLDGPICSIVVDERWRQALTDIGDHPRIQVLYWMHHARRDLVLQTPLRTGRTTGTFALRSPVRPNPIASSIVALVGIDGGTLHVRGLDCLDGTPLVDLKPDLYCHPGDRRVTGNAGTAKYPTLFPYAYVAPYNAAAMLRASRTPNRPDVASF